MGVVAVKGVRNTVDADADDDDAVLAEVVVLLFPLPLPGVVTTSVGEPILACDATRIMRLGRRRGGCFSLTFVSELVGGRCGGGSIMEEAAFC